MTGFTSLHPVYGYREWRDTCVGDMWGLFWSWREVATTPELQTPVGAVALGPWPLPRVRLFSLLFASICSILELEAAISMAFACLTSNLSFSMIFATCLAQFAAFWSYFQRYLQHVWVRTSYFPLYLQDVGARTVHVTWQFATRADLGLVLGLV